jgi:hypothetical protein
MGMAEKELSSLSWTTMAPLRLGKVPSGLGLQICSSRSAMVSVSSSCRLVWREPVFVGYGHRIYVIDPTKKLFSEIFLKTCCAYLFSKQGSCDDQGLNFPPQTRDL